MKFTLNRLLSTVPRSLVVMYIFVLLNVFFSNSVYAEDCYLDTNDNGTGDSTAGAESNGNHYRLACGRNATATGDATLAVGYSASATGNISIAIGNFSDAAGYASTALGDVALSKATGATSLGHNAAVNYPDATAAIAIGHHSRVGSFLNSAPGAIAIGGDSDASQVGARADGTQSVALGAEARTTSTASGAIAIGGDMDGNGVGAKATAENAIAIGADTIANVANTVVMGYPLRVIRDDGTTQIRANEKDAGSNVRTLFNLICDYCTPAFRFQQVNPSDQTWFFRMLQNGNFSVDDPATTDKEAEFRSGGNLVIGGILTENSDRGNKQRIDAIDSAEVLQAVANLPISKWEYKGEDGVKHLGPMAQDFYSAFGLGDTPRGIASIDTSGVALAAIQGLNQIVKEKDAEIAAQRVEITSQRSKITDLEKRFEELESGQERLAALEEMLRKLAAEGEVALR